MSKQLATVEFTMSFVNRVIPVITICIITYTNIIVCVVMRTLYI